LFARELLKAIPLAGKPHYRRVLEENNWVALMHAAPYAAKIQSLPSVGNEDKTRQIEGSIVVDWMEGLAFVFLSRYLRIRAYLTNVKFRSHGQEMRLFHPILTRNSCVYTSNFYRWLRELWGMPPMV